jgi:acetyltransferase-like isoleucine patch superfamily enzyme
VAVLGPSFRQGCQNAQAGTVAAMFQPGELSPRVRNAAAAVIQRSWEWICAVGATGPGDRHGKRFRSMGERSMLAFPPGQLFNEHWIEIGAHTLIGPHVSMSVGFWNEDLDRSAPPVIRIGDRVNIGRGSSLVGRVGITIGDDVTAAPNVYVTDHNHAYEDVEVPIKDQWPHEAPVSIGAGSWLGVGAVILPGTTVGEHVTVAAGSVVRGDIPDRSVVAGVPGRVVRRWVDGAWDPPVEPRSGAVPDEWTA